MTATSFGVAVLDDGSTRIEWDVDSHRCSADFDVDGTLYVHSYDAATGSDAEWTGRWR